MQPTTLHLPRLGAYVGIVREVEGRESIDPHQAMPRCSGLTEYLSTVALGTCSLTVSHLFDRSELRIGTPDFYRQGKIQP